jgi:hypothetical protein
LDLRALCFITSTSLAFHRFHHYYYYYYYYYYIQYYYHTKLFTLIPYPPQGRRMPHAMRARDSSPSHPI